MVKRTLLLAFPLVIALVNCMTTEEHVRHFFRPEHRAYLAKTTSLTLEDDSVAVENVPQNDESTKCLSDCEPACDKLNVPDYLTRNESFFQFQREPINCVLASTVVFNKNHKCQWLSLYFFDCCRACNANNKKCFKELRRFLGGPEFCYRDHFQCAHRCLEKHNLPENSKLLPPQ